MQKFYDEDNLESEIKLQKPRRFTEHYYISVGPVFKAQSLSFIDNAIEQEIDMDLSKGVELTISGFSNSDFLRHIEAIVSAGIYSHQTSVGKDYDTFDFNSSWEFGKRWRFGNGVGFRKKDIAHNFRGDNRVSTIKTFYMNFIANHQNRLSRDLYYKIQIAALVDFGGRLKTDEKANSSLSYSVEGKLTKKIDDFIYSLALNFEKSRTEIEEIEALTNNLNIHLGISFPI